MFLSLQQPKTVPDVERWTLTPTRGTLNEADLLSVKDLSIVGLVLADESLGWTQLAARYPSRVGC